jgi:type VI protein secretion system component VasF
MRKRIDEKLRARLSVFVREYARKAPRHGEPNDRGYDRKLEKLVKRLSPEELSKLLNDDGQAEDRMNLTSVLLDQLRSARDALQSQFDHRSSPTTATRMRT